MLTTQADPLHSDRLEERLERHAAAGRHLSSVPAPACDHLHDTTSRYDRAEKLLTFLLVCHACGTEKVIVTLPYEPRFEQQPARMAA
jgi:hypothetical protein